jgi:phage shock protein PspC (stress-responsive transcriptional regulator)
MNRRLYRSRTDRVLAGVAAGVANWLNADPALVRVAWVILAFVTSGLAVLVYVVMAFVVSEEPMVRRAAGDVAAGTNAAAEPVTETMTTETQPRESNGPLILGILLVGIGLVFLVREYIPALDWDRLWPIAIIAVGGLLLVNSMRRREG